VATSADFKVILTIDSQGNAKIEEVKKALGDVEQGAKNANQGGAAAADEFAGAMMRQLGIAALVTAGFYKLEQVAVGAFKAGIQAVDDYKLTTIGVAATLTDMAQDQSKGQDNYTRALAYSKDMFNELELAAARYFASGKEMTQAWNILAQKGIVLRKEEIDSLGVIVDRIKLSTQGQVSSIQIAQEMRAMLTGQARTTDQIGMLLKDRIPNLEQEIAKHQQIGDLVTWLGDQFKGLKYASQDIQGTLESQKSTLDTLLTQVGRGGLEGAYGDIAGWLRQMNDYLLTHRDELAGGISRGWEGVKDLTKGILGFIQEIENIGKKGIVIPISFSIGGMGKWLSEGGEGGTYDVEDFWGKKSKVAIPATPDFGFGALIPDQFTEKEKEAWNEFGGYEEPLPLSAREVPKPAALRKITGGKGKGSGGSGRDTTDTLENLILQLRQEEAKLTEGAFAGVDAWYVKITEKIRKLAMDDGQLKDGMLAAAEAKAAKEQKISDDLNKKYLQATHQTTAAQEADDKKLIDQMTGHPTQLQQAWDIYYAHKKDQADKLAMAENQQQKGYYDFLASASLLIEDQIVWKGKSWELEKKISQEQLEQWFVGKDINDSQKDEYRSMLALTNQAKEYNLARQKAVDLGTMEGWAIERAGEALKKDKTSIKDLMSGAEKYFTDAFSSGLTGVLSRDKKKLTDIWSTIFQGAILEINKGGITRSFDSLAKLMAPKPESTVGGVTGATKSAESGLNTAAQSLKQGGLGLNSAGLQLATSAGGLLLSGIGIATNSQALVIAGTVLQLAGLAIQLYETLTATTTAIAMTTAAIALTGSAGALGAAATALMMAAAVDAIPFFHTGGLVAHSGLLVAHNGLDLDERIVKVQTGEGIIKRGTMADYARAGISFDDLNNGRLPVIDRGSRGAGPDGLNGSTVNNYDNKQATINVTIGDIHAYDMTPQEAEKFVAREIIPAINKQLGDRARNLFG
jgi:hypothetical protein